MKRRSAIHVCAGTFLLGPVLRSTAASAEGSTNNRDQKATAAEKEFHLRTTERFSFTANTRFEEAGPLFGADEERKWAPHWNPRFVNPLPPSDQPGMVFTVEHGETEAVWVNTEFDLANGRIQYVYVIPDALTTVITLRLAPAGKQTRVDVEYVRTALSKLAEPKVRSLAEQDRQAGSHWERQINDYLVRRAL